MYRSYSPGAIGVKVEGLAHSMDLARRHGFAGVHFSIDEAQTLGAAQTLDLAEEKGVRLSAWGFPLNFRASKREWTDGLALLPAQAEVAAQLGVRRTATWIMPCSDELSYSENFAFHVDRLKPAAAILADQGIWLGLEYVGPKTLWDSKKYEFVHNMKQMTELCGAIGAKVGFLLDSWHWYTSRETVADLQSLQVEQVVDVHVNDAPDIPVDEQVDNVRDLPGATGVIDIAAFLGTLKVMGVRWPGDGRAL